MLDYYNIKSKAYEFIISLNATDIPIDPLKITLPNIYITSFQNYSKMTGVSISDLTLNNKFKDGYIIYYNNIKIILYDEEKYEPRKRFTLYHEIGHSILRHKQHNAENEAEANFFAAQLLIPDVIIKEIIKRGYKLTIKDIMSIFGVSDQCASIRDEYLKKYFDKHPNEYDDAILLLFNSFLNINYPDRRPRQESFFYNEDDI